MLTGGGSLGAPYAPGVLVLDGGSVRLLGTTQLNSGATPTYPGYGVIGRGKVRVAPTVTINGATAPFGHRIVPTTTSMPSLVTSSVPLSGSITLRGTPGHLGFVAVAMPGPLTTLPDLDAIWLDPATVFLYWTGVIGANGAAALQAPLPPLPGLLLMWQGQTLAPNGVPAISNPSVMLLR